MNRLEYPKFLKTNPSIWGLSLETVLGMAVTMFVSGNILRFKEEGVLATSVIIYFLMNMYQRLFKKNALYFFLKSKSELEWKHALKKGRREE